MTPTRNSKNFSPIMHYGKNALIPNAASPKNMKAVGGHSRAMQNAGLPPNTIL